jgi:hypothetical protein
LQLCWVGLAELFSETICNVPGQTFLLKNANVLEASEYCHPADGYGSSAILAKGQ